MSVGHIEHLENASTQEARPAERKIEGLFFATVLLVLLWRFTYKSTLYLSFFTDDFFYYAMVAKHIVCCGLSSFNGLQQTNGYHPLWMLTLALLYRAFRNSSGQMVPFFIAVVVMIWLLIIGSYRALRATQKALGLEDDNFSFICAIVSLTFMTVLSRTGMEISLALFFLILFWQRMAITPLEDQPPVQAFTSGLIASCAILSRIDCVLAILLYSILALKGKRSGLLRGLLPFAAGLVPIAVYLGINWMEFHTLLPVSGMAKNLKPLGSFSGSALRRLIRVDPFNILFTWPSIGIGMLYGAGLLLRPGRQIADPPRRRILLCVLLHPILFFGILSFTSDWPLWTWYLYVFVPITALLGPAVLRNFAPTLDRLGRLRITGALALVCIAVLATLTRLNPAEVDLYSSAVAIQQFAALHPGRYAMGDRAGTPAWLIDQPIVQLEGLVGDRPFLQRIVQRENLVNALAELGIDFYVTASARPSDRCFVFREPVQAGPQSPAMSGRLCTSPVATFGKDEYVTRIFDLRRSTDVR